MYQAVTRVLTIYTGKLDCKTVRIIAYSSTREQSNKRPGTGLACEARELRARKTHTPRFTDFFTDFDKKPTILQSMEKLEIPFGKLQAF